MPDKWLFGILIGLAIAGIFGFARHWRDRQQYEAGMQAYELANCKDASQNFQNIINAVRFADIGDYVPRAKVKQAECEFFLQAIDPEESES